MFKRIHRSIPVFFALGICIVSLAQVANAETWTWSSSKPQVVSKVDVDPTQSNVQDFCWKTFRSSMEEVDLRPAGITAIKKTDCLIASAEGYSLYSYNYGKLAIKFVGDKEARVIENMSCRLSCAYLPSNDTFVVVESNNTAGTGRVAFYKDFVKKLEHRQPLIINNDYYEFTQTSPSKIISDFYGSERYVGYAKRIQRSDNDRWLLIEFQGSGIFRYDVSSGYLLKFSDWQASYGRGADASIEFDITNDGKRVAIMGMNSDNTIYDIVSDCGRNITGVPNDIQVHQTLDNPCPMQNLGNTPEDAPEQIYMPRLRDTHQPRFDDDGGEITFYATSYDPTVSTRFITLRANGYTTQRLDYLAIGDSYSSGEGDTLKDGSGKKFYRANTDTSSENCHLSTRSYPYILASGMQLTNNRWNSIACSGATVWDVKMQGSFAYLGQNDRLKGAGNYIDLKASALNEFIPGRKKQVEFVKKYRPATITLTMGGNDIGFASKLQQCILEPGTCVHADAKKIEFRDQIVKQYENLKQLYIELYEKSGSISKIYVLGYPQFINGEANATCGANVGLLDSQERKMIHSSVELMNNVIEQAAESAGVKYIDIENSLLEHRLCDTDKKYVTGISDPFDINGNRQESFHPNAQGHMSMAADISKPHNLNYQSLLEYDNCPLLSINICPNGDVNDDSIVIPEFFEGGDDTQTSTQYKNMTSDGQTAGKNMNVTLRPYSFARGESVSVVVHSDPIDLGQYVAGDDGSLEIDAVLPSSLPPGYHTLIISGRSYSGDPIEYEQSILVKGINSNDIDSDGILDTEDKCLLIPVSNTDIDKDGIDDACDAEISDPPIQSPSPSPTPTTTPSPSPNPTPQTPADTIAVVFAKVVKAVLSFINSLISLLQKMLVR
jgi:lysophospholipase L1-like esterase